MKTYRPTTPSRRGMSMPDYSMITKNKPEKKLLAPLKKTGARSHGKISVRHRGGGAKRNYRLVDFGKFKNEVKAKVLGIEYDPNRSARIALLEQESGALTYIIAPQELKTGSIVMFSGKTDLFVGNRMQLKNIPVGTFVHNVEMTPGMGGQIARSAGTAVKMLAIDGKYATISLPSGEVRKILAEGYATIGIVSNPQHNLQTIGKAGRIRHMGRRPIVRGTAMNPKDHPHGGGEGRTPIGLKYPKTPWGKIARGVRTRNKKKYSRKLILQRRTKN